MSAVRVELQLVPFPRNLVNFRPSSIELSKPNLNYVIIGNMMNLDHSNHSLRQGTSLGKIRIELVLLNHQSVKHLNMWWVSTLP